MGKNSGEGQWRSVAAYRAYITHSGRKRKLQPLLSSSRRVSEGSSLCSPPGKWSRAGQPLPIFSEVSLGVNKIEASGLRRLRVETLG